jgi:predicted enzyme related to lactoylglutathione lyase
VKCQIKEVAFLYHQVSDIVRARSFYEKTLGMRIGREYEGAPAKWWIEYDVAGVAFAITNMERPEGNGGAVPVFEVIDIESAAEALRAAGATFVEPLTEYPYCRSFMITDPDGNRIGFHQLKPAAEIPVFQPTVAQRVEPYIHEATGRTVAHRQVEPGGRIHLFSPTGFYVATERNQP